jgi:two-component system sensor histidine kinase KdpD
MTSVTPVRALTPSQDMHRLFGSFFPRRAGPSPSPALRPETAATRHPLVHVAAVAAFMAAAAGSAVAQNADRPITAAIVFLLGVTVAGALEGVWGGLIAALAASVAYNFFLIEPTFRFSLATLEDYVPIIAFNVSAAASGLVTGRLRDRARAAERATRRVSSLLDLSERLQAAVSLPDVAAAIRTFVGRGGEVELHVACGPDLDPVEPEPRHAALAGTVFAQGRPALRDGHRLASLLSSDAAFGVLVLAWVDGSQRDLSDEDLGALVNLVSLATERCLLLQRLADAELVRKSEEFKTALLSSVSHDMRTPLSAISASASSLAQYGGDLDDSAKADMLNTIQEQCRRLNRYTTKLLSLGRLQAGLDRDRFTACDALEVLGTAIGLVRGLGSGHDIVKKIEPAEALVKADPVMLEQVFYNILENSVRYSDPGTAITVSAAVRRSRLLVSIRDVGRGIPVGEFARVFERFYRAGASPGGEGSGLGLAIAKGFTEAFGGRIWAGVPEDAAGGTIVTVELPLADAQAVR